MEVLRGLEDFLPLGVWAREGEDFDEGEGGGKAEGEGVLL